MKLYSNIGLISENGFINFKSESYLKKKLQSFGHI